LWAIWHWPSSIQRGDTAKWIAFGFLGSVGLRILIVWLYNNTGESVFAAILFHVMANVGKTVFPDGVSYYDPAVGYSIIAITAVIVTVLWGPRTLTGYSKVEDGYG
jgi:uncharacterized protein